jgi:translocation and assembly module TamA
VVFVANNSNLQKAVNNMLEQQRATNSKYSRASSLSTAAKYDTELIQQFMRSRGYYAATIENTQTNGQVAHQIYPGPRYTIAKLTFDWPENVGLPPDSIVNIKKTDPLVAQQVLDSVASIKRWVADEHCLRDIEVSYQAVVHHPDQSATLVFSLQPSPQLVFGPLSYSGNTDIEDSYLTSYLGFVEGDCFKPRLLDDARLKLLQTNLLANVDPLPGDIVSGAVPIHFRVTERKQRSIFGSIGYDADVKTKVTAGWEHRNMFGRGEQLTAEITHSSISKGLNGSLTFPHFLSPKQRLTLTGNLAQETPEAYDVYLGEAGANIKRELTTHLSANVGTRLKFSRVKEFENPEDFALLSLPVSLDYSARNNPLNPTRGWASGLQIEPFADLYQTSRRFTRSTVAGSTYLTADRWRLKPTLALRMAIGTIDGSSLADVPVDERFYVGGGGSVRGYKYQSIGELDIDNIPLGGLSFSEVSLELRSRISSSIGITVFVDGGNTYTDKAPAFGKDFLYGAGIGLRYHTAFAPFRFDIAKPLDKREGDSSYQIYIAIGQAF